MRSSWRDLDKDLAQLKIDHPVSPGGKARRMSSGNLLRRANALSRSPSSAPRRRKPCRRTWLGVRRAKALRAASEWGVCRSRASRPRGILIENSVRGSHPPDQWAPRSLLLERSRANCGTGPRLRSPRQPAQGLLRFPLWLSLIVQLAPFAAEPGFGSTNLTPQVFPRRHTT